MHLFLLNLNCGRYLKSLMAIGRQIMKISTKYTIYRATPRKCTQSSEIGVFIGSVCRQQPTAKLEFDRKYMLKVTFVKIIVVSRLAHARMHALAKKNAKSGAALVGDYFLRLSAFWVIFIMKKKINSFKRIFQ